MNIQNPNTHSPIKAPTTLHVGLTQVLFFKSEPLALTSGGDVFFLDTPTLRHEQVHSFQRQERADGQSRPRRAHSCWP